MPNPHSNRNGARPGRVVDRDEDNTTSYTLHPPQLVVHLRDGQVLQGLTYDFDPGRDTFHLTAPGASEMLQIESTEVRYIEFLTRPEEQGTVGPMRRSWPSAVVVVEDGTTFQGRVSPQDRYARGRIVETIGPRRRVKRTFVPSWAVQRIDVVEPGVELWDVWITHVPAGRATYLLGKWLCDGRFGSSLTYERAKERIASAPFRLMVALDASAVEPVRRDIEALGCIVRLARSATTS